jgi:hypothetical protein
MGDAILPFGRGDRSPTLSKETLLFASRTIAQPAILSAPMSGPVVGDRVAVGVPFRDEDCRFGWSILTDVAFVVPLS